MNISLIHLFPPPRSRAEKGAQTGSFTLRRGRSRRDAGNRARPFLSCPSSSLHERRRAEDFPVTYGRNGGRRSSHFAAGGVDLNSIACRRSSMEIQLSLVYHYQSKQYREHCKLKDSRRPLSSPVKICFTGI